MITFEEKLTNDFLDVSYIPHLFHNCSSRVMTYNKNVDKLIGHVENSIIKSNGRKKLFENMAPPQTILTRFGTWLEACKYYIKYLPGVKEIVSGFEEDGSVVKNAKEVLQDQNHTSRLIDIQNKYIFLGDFIEKSILMEYSIENEYNDLIKIQIDRDQLKQSHNMKQTSEILACLRCCA